MIITIFGGTGEIGNIFIRYALYQNHILRVYARNPDKIGMLDKKMKIFTGELNDYDKIREAIAGSDVVVSTLGPPIKRNYKGSAFVEGHKNIVKAMEAENVKRFITIATPSIRSSQDIPSLTTRLPGILAKLFLPKPYKEIVQVGEIVSSSNLDWTIVRFIALNNKRFNGQIKVTFGENKLNWSVSRANVADFIRQQLTDTKYIRSMPILVSKKYKHDYEMFIKRRENAAKEAMSENQSD